ncbi:MAG: serine--tRNA ligase [Rhodospirillales bacterium]|nr:serine--tRNA ligase [Rhodospirillales bacterium]
MLDIKWIRENADAFDAGLARRGLPAESQRLLALDQARRDALSAAQEMQARRNAISKEIGRRKGRGEDAADILAEVARCKDEQAALETAAGGADAELQTALAVIPNLPAADVPDGRDEAANIEISRWGEPRTFDFAAREHFDIGGITALMDFDRAARLSGARFVVLRGALARLERALANFMLDLHTESFGYTEISPPALVRDEAVFGTGQLPKFKDDLFAAWTIDRERAEDKKNNYLSEQSVLGREVNQELLGDFYDYIDSDEFRLGVGIRYWLIPTAEVPLTNLVAGEILAEDALPLRQTAMTWCFRAEAGAAGKDTRGMIRQHQFTKVELVSITSPEQSDDEHERMTACAEEVLKRLGLPYRVVLLCTGDMGFSARKTYDIEVWLPGQGRYREISSCSNCGDFQARRMNARCRKKGEKNTRFVHTLNGSGLAVGRTLIAVLENCQQADGSVVVPDVLRPYMGGLDVIGRHGPPSA